MIETAHAILLLEDRYVLQLRDARPDISSSGQWSLFGGRLERGEEPARGMRRELLEELGIEADELHPLKPIDHFAEFERQTVRLWLFWGRIDSAWPRHDLREGQDVQAFAFERLASLDIPGVMRLALESFHHQQAQECKP